MSIAVALVAGLVLSILPICMVSIAVDVSEIKKELRISRQIKEGDGE